MNSEKTKKVIQSYLVRCWQEKASDASGRPAWRFTLTELDAQRTRKGFDSLDQLFEYLRGELVKNGESQASDA